MGKLNVFNSISLDGYFVDRSGDMSWAHNEAPDQEWDAFVNGNTSGGGLLVFGRVTYEMMAAWWPTPMALQSNPEVARGINAAPKAVFSRTLRHAEWNNTKVLSGDLPSEIRRLKHAGDVAVLGSGNLVSQLVAEGLVDELQLVVVPVILGSGRTLFEGIRGALRVKRTSTRAFRNGNVLLCYQPA